MANQSTVIAKVSITNADGILLDQFELTRKDVTFILDDKGWARSNLLANVVDGLHVLKENGR